MSVCDTHLMRLQQAGHRICADKQEEEAATPENSHQLHESSK